MAFTRTEAVGVARGNPLIVVDYLKEVSAAVGLRVVVSCSGSVLAIAKRTRVLRLSCAAGRSKFGYLSCPKPRKTSAVAASSFVMEQVSIAVADCCCVKLR